MLQLHPLLDINSTHEGGVWTALHEACDFGHLQIYRMLSGLERIDMNKRDNQGRTGLYWASFRGRGEIVWEMLEDRRVDINVPNLAGETPLWRAVQAGFILVAKRFFACSRELVDVTTVPNEHSQSAGMNLAEAARTSGNMELVKLVDDYLRDPNRVRFTLRRELGLRGKNFTLLHTFTSSWLEWESCTHLGCHTSCHSC